MDLDDAIYPDIDAPDEGTPRFVVDSLAKADWAAAVVVRHRRALAHAETLAAARKQAVDDWLETERAAHRRRTEWLEAQLVAWHRQQIDEDGGDDRSRRLTIRLPAGVTLKSVATRRRAEIEDQAAALAWAAANDATFVRLEPRLDRDAAKAAVLAGGEIPGVRVIPAGRNFHITQTKENQADAC